MVPRRAAVLQGIIRFTRSGALIASHIAVTPLFVVLLALVAIGGALIDLSIALLISTAAFCPVSAAPAMKPWKSMLQCSPQK